MNKVEKLKKYKELFDNEIITKEEFDKEKEDILAGQELNLSIEDDKLIKKINFINNKELKKIIIVILIMLLLLIAILIGYKIIINYQYSTRSSALESEIQDLMEEYGITTYSVKYNDYTYDIYAENFELLTKGNALELLNKLENVSVNDPYGDGEIDFGTMVHIHPGIGVKYSYWRVSSWQAKVNESFGGKYTIPGVYCDKDEVKCIYEAES